MSRLDESRLIALAIAEDIPQEDHTSVACPDSRLSTAEIISKQHGIIAGIRVLESVLKQVDINLDARYLVSDGQRVEPGTKIASIAGRVKSILGAERLALNYMQRMSGIATFTNQFVEAVEGTGVSITDTRKTTPLFRRFEKEAVRIGGGVNHRFSLSDMVMIKDNHIAACGGIPSAIHQVKKYLQNSGLELKVEIETASIADVQTVLDTGEIDRIMLDNFSVEEAAQAVRMINGRFEVEISGRITLESVREYADCGPDYISVGALTHSYKSLDLSLKMDLAMNQS